MASPRYEVQLTLRGDTTEHWETIDPVLGRYELAYDTDEMKLKLGDGVTPWSGLDWFTTGGGGGGDCDDCVTQDELTDTLANYATTADLGDYPTTAEVETLIAGTLQLGETSSTAYRGDRGKIAYDHTLLTNNPHGTTAAQVGAVPTSRTVNGKALSSDITLAKSDVGLGNVDNTTDAGKPISVAQQAALDNKADLVGGVIPTAQIPALAITSVTVVASQAAQLALSAQEGDMAVRSDQKKSYVKNAGTSGTMSDWTELQTPTDAVLSVAGQTGIVVLAKSDVGLGNVDNTSDANKPISTLQQAALDAKVPTTRTVNSKALSANISLDKTDVGLGNVDNTADSAKPVSTAQQSAIDAKYTKPGTGIPATDLASAVQTSLGKADTALQSAPVTSVAGKTGAVSLVKADVGLGNVDNTADSAKPVSTAQQTALDLKANLASPTFTGTVGGITKSMVGLGNVDNTADASKPVSTAQQTALDLKANLASPTLTGDPKAPTPSTGDNDTSIATTAFVQTAKLPTIRSLTDASTISVGTPVHNEVLTVTLGGNRTLGNPTGTTDGLRFQVRVKQDGSGTRTLAYDTAYAFGSSIPSPTLSRALNKMDRLLFEYNAASSKWELIAFSKGY